MLQVIVLHRIFRQQRGVRHRQLVRLLTIAPVIEGRSCLRENYYQLQESMIRHDYFPITLLTSYFYRSSRISGTVGSS